MSHYSLTEYTYPYTQQTLHNLECCIMDRLHACILYIDCVRHEVNGKHRVLAAYIIFTLEEAYRYNDRQ